MRRLLLTAAMVGCSDSGGDVPIDDLYNQLIDKYCDIYVRCGVIEDRPTCITLFQDQVDSDNGTIQGVKAGKITYHADKARACIDSFDSGTCERKFLSGAQLDSTACNEVFDGTIHADGMCANDAECISQDCNIPSCSTACCTGTCVGDTKPTKAAVGSACQSSNDCATGYCDLTAMTCAALLADGASCSSSSQCESYNCQTTCKPVVDEGAACTSTNDCKLIQDSCNTTKTCSAGVASGGACTNSADCHLTAYCSASAGMTCKDRPVLGESCAEALSCLDGSLCSDAGMCVARFADGSACTTSSQCESDDCDPTSKMCVAHVVCY
ncbi:MAG: hypothetical protein QM831_26245 [Kofleriaceae bacterium]